MRIIAFTGMPFSGKSEAVSIAKSLGIPVVRMGDRVWDEVKQRGLPLTNENVGYIADVMRKKKGKDVWAQRTVDTIKSGNISKVYVIDGIRNEEEIDAFKKEFGDDFLLVSIEVSDEIRHQRALKRNRVDDCRDVDEIKRRDAREIRWGINKVIKQADISFKNDTSLDSFQNKLKRFFDSM